MSSFHLFIFIFSLFPFIRQASLVARLERGYFFFPFLGMAPDAVPLVVGPSPGSEVSFGEVNVQAGRIRVLSFPYELFLRRCFFVLLALAPCWHKRHRFSSATLRLPHAWETLPKGVALPCPRRKNLPPSFLPAKAGPPGFGLFFFHGRRSSLFSPFAAWRACFLVRRRNRLPSADASFFPSNRVTLSRGRSSIPLSNCTQSLLPTDPQKPPPPYETPLLVNFLCQSFLFSSSQRYEASIHFLLSTRLWRMFRIRVSFIPGDFVNGIR